MTSPNNSLERQLQELEAIADTLILPDKGIPDAEKIHISKRLADIIALLAKA